MGMGGLAKAADKPRPSVAAQDDPETAEVTRVSSRPALTQWASGAFGRTTAGEASNRARRRTIAEEEEAEDDRHIRFTIGGVGQRMTKDGFIEEMQKFDNSTRREIIDQSSASRAVKSLAQHGTIPEIEDSDSPSRGKAVATSGPSKEEAVLPSYRQRRSPSTTPSPGTSPVRSGDSTSRDEPETAVERRRRLAVLRSVGHESDEVVETPAERRRREAALGVASPVAVEEDSDDDDTPRVPPPRRGITFADVPERGRR